MKFTEQVLASVRTGRRTRVVAALLGTALAIDQLLLWHWDVEHELFSNSHLPTESGIAFGGPPWGLGWVMLLWSAEPDLDGRHEYPYPGNPLGQLLYACGPVLVVALLAVVARATARDGARLVNGSAPESVERARPPVDWARITSAVTSPTAVLALVFTALSLKATRDQIGITAEGQITNRYTQAVQLLGTPGDTGRDLRLGGIYALERIAIDSPRDAGTISTLLSTFVRDHARRPGTGPCPPSPPADIQAAVNVVTGWEVKANRREQGDDLSGTCLAGLVLSAALLDNADLGGTDLTGARMTGTSMNDENLRNATLTGADLSNTFLNDTWFDGADLTGADLRGAHSREGGLNGANLTGATLTGPRSPT
ncbi:pentapeptide repeat-containing protein [Saccharothrix yanglingensis]|uniref:Pentapeptide repeat protein n=1 Tax=Saccharothrix yanglingensis TaxID=659496 RepID=A0ABU0WY45_9PSEU|nr:pentapeptide repeat-containing protein [Saccharothrix yanglingensis]MDQ2583994.1 hypothetical protein [Saccharothrix yanglingensis]